MSDKIVNEDAFVMFYSDYYMSNDGYFSDFEDFFDVYRDQGIENPDDIPDKPSFVYGTYENNIYISAESLIKDACDDHYDDAWDDVDKLAIRDLQKYIDKWLEDHGPGPVYMANTQWLVRIPWERY